MTDKPIKLKPNLTQEELEKVTAGLRMLINENSILRQQSLDAYFLITGGTLMESMTKPPHNFPTINSWIEKHLEIFPEEELEE